MPRVRERHSICVIPIIIFILHRPLFGERHFSFMASDEQWILKWCAKNYWVKFYLKFSLLQHVMHKKICSALIIGGKNESFYKLGSFNIFISNSTFILSELLLLQYLRQIKKHVITVSQFHYHYLKEQYFTKCDAA